MDVSKLLKNINNLTDYISITQEVVTKFSNSKIHFNMSTILALNKIKSIEIEVSIYILLFMFLLWSIYKQHLF